MFALSLIPLLMLPRPTFSSFERYFSALHLETFYPSARLLKAELAALSSQTCLSSHSACPLKYQPQELEGTWFLLFPWELSLVPFPSKFSLCMGLKKFSEKGPPFFRCLWQGFYSFSQGSGFWHSVFKGGCSWTSVIFDISSGLFLLYVFLEIASLFSVSAVLFSPFFSLLHEFSLVFAYLLWILILFPPEFYGPLLPSLCWLCSANLFGDLDLPWLWRCYIHDWARSGFFSSSFFSLMFSSLHFFIFSGFQTKAILLSIHLGSVLDQTHAV